MNLSDRTLTVTEKTVLEKGLQFIPTPKHRTRSPFLETVSDFGRKLKLISYFEGRPPFRKEPFTGKSKWLPHDKYVHPEINNTTSEITRKVKELEMNPETNNLPQKEIRALKKLRYDKNIVIKKADKGSATVIQNKTDYLNEGYRQLSNADHYTKLSDPLQPTTTVKIRDVLSKMLNDLIISEKQFHYLSPPVIPRPRRFYMLPKIHKDQLSWSIPSKTPPGRPIVSNCDSETDKIAEFIETFLQQKSQSHPSYIKDTSDFISKIKALQIPENALLITLDVDSMYTNINTRDGMQAFTEAFGDLEHFSYYPYVKELLELCLENNDFEFNGNTFLQKSGISMGIKFAPSFANIFMAKWEREALDKYPHQPYLYLRFLDDIFLIWTHGIEKFNEFLNVLNNHHPTINLKATVGFTSVNFLDTTVFKDELDPTKLNTKVFFKPTDTHALLHKKSFHPKSTFKSIVKSQILRFRRICTKETDFKKAWHILRDSLKKRNYSKRLLRKIYSDTLFEIESIERSCQELDIPGPSHWGHTKCDLSYCCIMCKASRIGNNLVSFATRNVYPIQGSTNCYSPNVIYVISCVYCYKQYVGQTERPIRYRFLEHYRAILKGEESNAVANHFLVAHPDRQVSRHNIPITIIPIEMVADQGSQKGNLAKRLDRERFWIDVLGTYSPMGLNSDPMSEKDARGNKLIIPVVVPYSKMGSDTYKIIQKEYEKLQQITGDTYENIRTIVAYKRHRNLKDILTSTKS